MKQMTLHSYLCLSSFSKSLSSFFKFQVGSTLQAFENLPFFTSFLLFYNFVGDCKHNIHCWWCNYMSLSTIVLVVARCLYKSNNLDHSKPRNFWNKVLAWLKLFWAIVCNTQFYQHLQLSYEHALLWQFTTFQHLHSKHTLKDSTQLLYPKGSFIIK
jgi:hypothetical protein